MTRNQLTCLLVLDAFGFAGLGIWLKNAWIALPSLACMVAALFNFHGGHD